jgi:SAM-dependent methyltransferase
MSATIPADAIPNLRRWSGAGPSDWQAYHAMVAAALRPGITVVDVGCGTGRVKPFAWERHPGVRLIGLDPDPAADDNPALDDFRLLDPSRPWPLEDASADLALARYVLEHVADPAAFLFEAGRVLKPGGQLLFLTPNRRHPAMLASGGLPLAWKRRILERTRGTARDEVFATHYCMNTPGELRRQLTKAGFSIERLEAGELEPCGYLEFSAPAYVVACAWYGLVRWTGLERTLGAHILGRARKPW